MALYRLTMTGMKRHIAHGRKLHNLGRPRGVPNRYITHCGLFAPIPAGLAFDDLPVCKRCASQAAPAEARPGAAEGGKEHP